MGVRLVDLDTLLAEADFMSVHRPKTPETVGLIGADELAQAKPSLVLVNAARGGIVDEAALYDALKTGRIAAAGLDVFAKEPCTDSRSEEHTSELQSLMRNSYAVFCLKKTNKNHSKRPH